MPTLARFIREHTEQILAEWETFARTLPMGGAMDIEALRDHAKDMLGVIADDLETPQTATEQADKAKGRSDAPEDDGATTAALWHGAGRAESGFTVGQMVSRALIYRAFDQPRPQRSTHNQRKNEPHDQRTLRAGERLPYDAARSRDARFRYRRARDPARDVHASAQLMDVRRR